ECCGQLGFHGRDAEINRACTAPEPARCLCCRNQSASYQNHRRCLCGSHIDADLSLYFGLHGADRAHIDWLEVSLSGAAGKEREADQTHDDGSGSLTRTDARHLGTPPRLAVHRYKQAAISTRRIKEGEFSNKPIKGSARN